MEDPLEELKRYIMNDGHTDTNSCSKESSQFETSCLLKSMKMIADEISEIAADDEDDYLLYPDDRDVSSFNSKFELSQRKSNLQNELKSKSPKPQRSKQSIISRNKNYINVHLGGEFKTQCKEQPKKLSVKRTAHDRLFNDSKRMNNSIQCKINYYREQEQLKIKQKPDICRNSKAITQRSNHLPIYHPQRIKNILTAKEKWREEQAELKKTLKKQAEENELKEMNKYKPKGRFNEDDFNEKYTRDINMYMQKFELFKKIKQELDVDGVTFQPDLINKDHSKERTICNEEVLAERLYKNANDIKQKHEKLYNDYFKSKHPFKPIINKEFKCRNKLKTNVEIADEKINQISIDSNDEDNSHIIKVIEALKMCIYEETESSYNADNPALNQSHHSNLSKSIQFSTLK